MREDSPQWVCWEEITVMFTQILFREWRGDELLKRVILENVSFYCDIPLPAEMWKNTEAHSQLKESNEFWNPKIQNFISKNFLKRVQR